MTKEQQLEKEEAFSNTSRRISKIDHRRTKSSIKRIRKERPRAQRKY